MVSGLRMRFFGVCFKNLGAPETADPPPRQQPAGTELTVAAFALSADGGAGPGRGSKESKTEVGHENTFQSSDFNKILVHLVQRSATDLIMHVLDENSRRDTPRIPDLTFKKRRKLTCCRYIFTDSTHLNPPDVWPHQMLRCFYGKKDFTRQGVVSEKLEKQESATKAIPKAWILTKLGATGMQVP